jgi:DNA-binding MarR family transcriptional regulator
MTVIPQPLKHAMRNPETTCLDVKVLSELHEILTPADFRAVKPWYIAELLHADRSSVQRALAHLSDLGYLERGDKNGNGFTFRLSLPTNGNHSPPPAVAA